MLFDVWNTGMGPSQSFLGVPPWVYYFMLVQLAWIGIAIYVAKTEPDDEDN